VTPLRIAANTYGFTLNRTRSFGFTHSSAEAVQLARFIAGEIEPPDEIWPLVSESRDPAKMVAAKPPASDVYVVEICSAKELRLGSWLIQLNYLVRRFPDFFSDIARRGAFWRLSAGEDRSPLNAYLDTEWTADATQRAEAEVLRQITLHQATTADLERDMRWLRDHLPEVVFVTHVDALRADGAPIPSRSSLIANVEAVARRLGTPVFNPTGAMNAFGQTEALESGSQSLAHYSDAFSARVGDLLLAEGVSEGLIRKAVLRYDSEEMVLRHLERRTAQSNTAQLDAIIFWTITQRPKWTALARWYLEFSVKTGRPERAASLIREGCLAALTPPERVSFTNLCAEREENGLLALIYDAYPSACAELPYLLRLRLEGSEGAINLPQVDDILEAAERLHRDGHDRTALALLLEEHPEARAGKIKTPAVRDLAVRLLERSTKGLSALDLAALLILARDAGLDSVVTAPLQHTLSTAVMVQVYAARQSGDLNGLINLSELLGPARAFVPNMFRHLAHLALQQRRHDVALSAALEAARLDPENPEPAVFAMRAAAQRQNPFLAEEQANRVLALIPDPEHRYRVEAEKRLKALPRMFYNLAKRSEDPIAKIRLYRGAQSSPELFQRSGKEAEAHERAFLQSARDRLVDGDDTLFSDLEKARPVLADQQRLLFLMGRFLVLRSRFIEAQPIWQTLVDLNPDNDGARAELDRCKSRKT